MWYPSQEYAIREADSNPQIRASRNGGRPFMVALNLAAKVNGVLQRNLPAKSSQFGTLRPTKLDKIKNLSHQVRGDGVNVHPPV